ncbi:hypothetical protein Tco_0435816 [Tanacetum coccineum]
MSTCQGTSRMMELVPRAYVLVENAKQNPNVVTGLAVPTEGLLSKILQDSQSPLTLVDSKNKAYCGGYKQEGTFQILKEKLSMLLVKHSRWTRYFWVYCDASKQGFLVRAAAASKICIGGTVMRERHAYTLADVLHALRLKPEHQKPSGLSATRNPDGNGKKLATGLITKYFPKTPWYDTIWVNSGIDWPGWLFNLPIQGLQNREAAKDLSLGTRLESVQLTTPDRRAEVTYIRRWLCTGGNVYPRNMEPEIEESQLSVPEIVQETTEKFFKSRKIENSKKSQIKQCSKNVSLLNNEVETEVITEEISMEGSVTNVLRQEPVRAYAAARGWTGFMPGNLQSAIDLATYIIMDRVLKVPEMSKKWVTKRRIVDSGSRVKVPDKCPKARNQQNDGARARAYVVVENPQQNPNVVTGTFLLNDHYACILFDSGAEKSFVSLRLRFY